VASIYEEIALFIACNQKTKQKNSMVDGDFALTNLLENA
jgi:hypothetical protein